MPHRFIAKRLERFFIYRVLHVDDTPHRIALGVAVGIFVTWTPTIGLQMILTVLISALLRANKFVGVPFVWISNPLTLVPVYWPSYLIGCWLLGGDYSYQRFLTAMHKAMTFGGGWFASISNWWEATIELFWPLWIGSLLVALILGTLTYFTIYYAVVAYRRRWNHKHPGRQRWNQYQSDHS